MPISLPAKSASDAELTAQVSFGLYRAERAPQEKLVPKKMTFRGGVVLKPDRQQTDSLPVESLPAPRYVTIPLLQHSGGVPAQPVVKPGDHVATGQMIGEPHDEASAPVHASICGTVIRFDRFPYAPGRTAFAIVIENDGREEFSSPIPYSKPWTEADPGELLSVLALSGIVDGCAPVHTKLAGAASARVETLIVNAVTDEPYLAADSRLLFEQAEKALTGILICKKITGASRCIIALSDTKPDLASAISEKMSGERFAGVSLATVKTKYPQHVERLLIRACTGKELPSGASSVQEGCMVLDGATAVYLRDAVMECMPWYQRVVTVAGPLVGAPKNLLVRIGTPLRNLLEACCADTALIKKLVLGGPLSGIACHDLDAPVTKATSAILPLGDSFPALMQHACINCGQCVGVCPMRIAPSLLAALVRKNDVAQAVGCSLMECIGCGCCAYVCPSKINLVHFLEFGKLQERMIERAATGQRSVA
jgi:Na+-translocating ferredoxin:NAD+ oxidoreductase subunit C